MATAAAAPFVPTSAHRALFVADRDYDAFCRCLAAPKGGAVTPEEAAWVRVKAAGGLPLLLRPGTTDARVLVDTFEGLYHLPPKAVEAEGVILDLGANVGHTAAHFAAIYPKARIIAVELDGQSAAVARRVLAPLGPRVVVLHGAAWDADGTVIYGGDEEWGFAAGDAPASGAALGGRTAPAMRVETILARCGVGRVAYAKVDIEGGEGRIVRDGAAWLQSTATIKIEVHPPAATLEGMERSLRGAGFATRRDDRHWSCVVGER